MNTVAINEQGVPGETNSHRELSFLRDSWTWYALILPVGSLSILLALEAVFLWEKLHLQFFPLAVGAAIWFLYQEGSPQYAPSAIRKVVAVSMATLVHLISICAIVLSSAWLAHANAIIAVFAWGLGRFGNMTWLRIAGIAGLLAVTLPAPFDWDEKLIHSLQDLSSLICSRLMDVFSIVHVRQGNVIEIASIPLFVEEACSGVDSQYALMAVAGVLLLIGRAGWIVSLITIVTVPIWAILGNLLRIFSIVIGLEWFSVNLSSGTEHTILGLLVFLVAAWAHWSSVQLLNFVELTLADRGIYLTRQVDHRFLRGGSSPALRVPVFALMVPALLLLTLPLSYRAFQSRFESLAPTMTEDAAKKFPSRQALPTLVGSQSLVDYREESRNVRNRWGQHSHTWIYGGNLGSQIASLDMPFRGWHGLWTCYASSGWTIEEQREVPYVDPVSGTSFPFYELVMKNHVGETYVLHFSLFDEAGNPYSFDGSLQETGREKNRIWVALRRLMERQANAGNAPTTFQFQLLSRAVEATEDDYLSRLRELYAELRNSIHLKTVATLRGMRSL